MSRRWILLSYLIFVTLGTTGCGSEGSPAPVDPGLIAALPSGPTAEMREIVMILPGASDPELETWERAAREEAGLAQALFLAERPAREAPAASQAELIREVARRGTSVLIVVAADAAAVAPALVEARDQGVPIVLLARPVLVPGKPLPLVTFPSFEESARKIVTKAIQDAKDAGFPAEGPALILSDPREDGHSRARLAALEVALKGGGVRLQEVIPYDSATTPLQTILDAPSRATIVLIDEDSALSNAVAMIRGRSPGGRPILGGFVSDPRNMNLAMFNECAALVDRNVAGAARQAVRSALALVRGEAVADRIEVKIPFQGSKGPPQVHPSLRPVPVGP